LCGTAALGCDIKETNSYTMSIFKRKQTKDEFGRTDLHYAARDSNVRQIAKFIKSGFDINLQDKNGWTPLHFACQANSYESVKALIDAGAKIELKDKFGNTPLWRATFCSRGNGDVIKALRDSGANPLEKNASGISPVELARDIANYNIAQFFEDV
jgi:ankyrin repeat protein